MLKTHIATLCCCLLLSFTVNAQRYAMKRDYFQKENFDPSDYGWGNWELDLKGQKAKVKNDALQISNSDGEMFNRPIHPQPGFEAYIYDFELGMDITFNSADPNAQAGFFFMSPQINSGYLYAYITASGEYGLRTANDIAVSKTYGPEKSADILIGKTNKMLLRKIGLSYQIIVNDKTVFNEDVDNRYWGMAYYSFYFNHKQKTTVDNFTIKAFMSKSSPALTFVDSKLPGKKDYKNTANNFSFLYEMEDTQKFIIRESKDQSRLEIKIADGAPDIQMDVVDYRQSYLDSIAFKCKWQINWLCYNCEAKAKVLDKVTLENGLEVNEIRTEVDFGTPTGKVLFMDMFIFNPASKKKIIHLQSYGLPAENSEKIMYFAMNSVIALSMQME